MTVVVNGQVKECPDGISLAQFIEHLQLKSDRVAVEVNLQIAPRNRWKETVLREGDRLEIVHFVGGGRSSLFPHVTVLSPAWSHSAHPFSREKDTD
jgi:thiamine biosynthesis protein ThiS